MMRGARGLAGGVGGIWTGTECRVTARGVGIPTNDVAARVLGVTLAVRVSKEGVNNALRMAANGRLAGVLAVSDEPLASCDYNHDPRSAIVDMAQTRAVGDLVSVLTWFDNEWAYANRMLDVVAHWLRR